MKPAPFAYLAPDSIDEALALLHQHGAEAKLLAGGQSLIPALNFRCLKPSYVIDLNLLQDLDYIRKGAGGELRIGAMTRYHTLEFDPLVAAHAPLVHHAIPYIAHTAIRSRGTLGGSLAYADPAAELPAVTMALGARIRVASAGGERWIHAADFYHDMFVTALRPDELLVEVVLPAMLERTYWSFHEVARRHGDRVMTGAAVVVTVDGNGICRAANLVHINAARTPFSAKRSAQALLGGSGAAADIDAVVEMIVQEVSPEDDVHATAGYRRHLAGELTRRALTDIFSQVHKVSQNDAV